MRTFHTLVLALLISLAGIDYTFGTKVSPSVSPLPITGPTNSTLIRDVLIIGGGATGTYAAINLTDSSHSVTVVEATHRLGGHAATFFDPVSDRSAEYGVIVLSDEPVVHDFLTQLNTSWTKTPMDGSNIHYFDFRTGLENPDDVEPKPFDAFSRYYRLLLKYPFLLAKGIVLPDPVPEELLMSLGDFIEKHELSELSRIFFQWGQGLGDVWKIPVLYAMKYFSQAFVLGAAGTQFISPDTGSMKSIYRRAASLLGDKVLYDSRLKSIDRSHVDRDGYIHAVVSTSSGDVRIKTRKLLVTIPPLLGPSYLDPINPDSTEKMLFSQFKHFNLWAAAIKDPALPPTMNLQNVAPAPGDWATAFGTPHDEQFTENQVKTQILQTLERLHANAGFPNSTCVGDAEVVAFNSHSPYELTVPVNAIRGGFYKKLYQLQGHLNTYWTAAAWDAHDSSGL